MNNKIKKIINKTSVIALILFVNLLFINTVQAGGVTFENPIKARDIKQLVEAILKVVVEFGAMIAVFFLVYAGFLFVKAQGSESEISKAKSVFFWTIVGGMILLGAHVLSRVIQNTVNNISG